MGLAEKTSLFDDNSDISWIDSPSIQALRAFISGFVTGKKRDCDGSPECTHYLEVANWAANCDALTSLPSDVRAFAAYAHDLVEVFLGRHAFISPDQIVKQFWYGDAAYHDFLVTVIQMLTDPPHLVGEERFAEQIRVANAEASGLVRYVRYADKYCTYKRDLVALRVGNYPAGYPAKCHRKLAARARVVEELGIEQRFKDRFAALQAEIEQTIDRLESPLVPGLSSKNIPSTTEIARLGDRLAQKAEKLLSQVETLLGRAKQSVTSCLF